MEGIFFFIGSAAAISLRTHTKHLWWEHTPSAPPPSSNWLDAPSFEVLIALCDAFFPSIDNEVELKSQLENSLEEIYPGLAQMKENPFLLDKIMLEHKSHLCRGALQAGVPPRLALAIENLTYNRDKMQIFMLLKVLSTSIGCFLLTGFLAPFQYLRLSNREQILRAFRDSHREQLRCAYQTFRRITAFIFLADVNEDMGQTTNPFWPHIHYEPEATVSKKHVRFHPCPTSDWNSWQQFRTTIASLAFPFAPPDVVAYAGMVPPDLGDEEVEVDVVVVGSGAGGGVLAAELTKQGYRVLVLEKGAYCRTEDFRRWREAEAMRNVYEQGGLCTTADGNILVLAGSTVGGGTTVNWSASFRTPAHVQAEWSEQLGLADFAVGGRFDASLDEVLRLLSVNSDQSFTPRSSTASCNPDNHEHSSDSLCPSSPPPSFVTNANNELLWDAASKIGMVAEKIPRNVKECVDCGHCCFGCPYGAKQSTLTALLEPILLHQASSPFAPSSSHPSSSAPSSSSSSSSARSSSYGRLHIIPHCEVHRVLFSADPGQRKKAVGVVGVVTMKIPGEQTRKIQLTVRAKIVVSSAGSIHTPALLLRSGLQHPKIGRHLSLHPVIGVIGISKLPHGATMGLASGVGMGVVVRSKSRRACTISTPPSETCTDSSTVPTEDFVLQTPPVHPGVYALFLPWKSGLQHKLMSLLWPITASFICIPRDRSSALNRVTIDAEGRPMMHYRLTPEDAHTVMAGLLTNLRAMHAAGAVCLQAAHETQALYVRRGGEDEERRFEAYLAMVREAGVQVSKNQVISAHQMGSCRMSCSALEGPTSPSGELFEVENLYVADASVFPTSLGLNPMVTVAAIAHMIARNVADKLQLYH